MDFEIHPCYWQATIQLCTVKCSEMYSRRETNRAALRENYNFYLSRMNGIIRSNVKKGTLVKIVLKKDQRTGVLTEGIVKDILTSSPTHHHGIKVRLEDGQVGRVKEIVE